MLTYVVKRAFCLRAHSWRGLWICTCVRVKVSCQLEKASGKKQTRAKPQTQLMLMKGMKKKQICHIFVTFCLSVAQTNKRTNNSQFTHTAYVVTHTPNEEATCRAHKNISTFAFLQVTATWSVASLPASTVDCNNLHCLLLGGVHKSKAYIISLNFCTLFMAKTPKLLLKVQKTDIKS